MAPNRKMDEKLLALRKLEQNLGNIAKTSRETGIAAKTLRQWRDKYGIRLGTALQIERLRERLITESFDLASHIVEAMHDAPLNHRAAALNQMIDKVLLLTELLDEEDEDEQDSQVETLQLEFVDKTGRISSTPPWASDDSEE